MRYQGKSLLAAALSGLLVSTCCSCAENVGGARNSAILEGVSEYRNEDSGLFAEPYRAVIEAPLEDSEKFYLASAVWYSGIDHGKELVGSDSHSSNAVARGSSAIEKMYSNMYSGRDVPGGVWSAIEGLRSSVDRIGLYFQIWEYSNRIRLLETRDSAAEKLSQELDRVDLCSKQQYQFISSKIKSANPSCGNGDSIEESEYRYWNEALESGFDDHIDTAKFCDSVSLDSLERWNPFRVYATIRALAVAPNSEDSNCIKSVGRFAEQLLERGSKKVFSKGDISATSSVYHLFEGRIYDEAEDKLSESARNILKSEDPNYSSPVVKARAGWLLNRIQGISEEEKNRLVGATIMGRKVGRDDAEINLEAAELRSQIGIPQEKLRIVPWPLRDDQDKIAAIRTLSFYNWIENRAEVFEAFGSVLENLLDDLEYSGPSRYLLAALRAARAPEAPASREVFDKWASRLLSADSCEVDLTYPIEFKKGKALPGRCGFREKVMYNQLGVS